MLNSAAPETLALRPRPREPERRMARTYQASRAAGGVSPSGLHVLDVVGEQGDLGGYRHVRKMRRSRRGPPDVLVIYRSRVFFIELISRRGIASKAQKQIRLEMLPAGAEWWMARSARAALMALHLSDVVFRRKRKPPQLKPWEGPFADPTRRLPEHLCVAAERAAYRTRR